MRRRMFVHAGCNLPLYLLILWESRDGGEKVETQLDTEDTSTATYTTNGSLDNKNRISYC